MNETLNKLKAMGLSMYRIAKELDIAYNTVIMWDKGTWQPNEENQKKLDELINRTRKK